MPQVVVCPSSLNAMAMFDGLIQATHQQILNHTQMAKFELILAKIKIMDEYYLSGRTRIDFPMVRELDLTPYESCFQLGGELSEGCSLVVALAALLGKFGFNKAQEIAVTYAANKLVKYDSTSIFDDMSVKYNISMTNNNGTSSALLTENYDMLRLYQTFFLVFDEGNDKILGPQPLSGYIKSISPIKVPSQKNLGRYISWILNGYSMDYMYRKVNDNQYNAIRELSDFLISMWLDALSAYLNVESWQEAILLVNSFWHAGLKSSLFQPLVERRQNGYLCGSFLETAAIHNLNKVCDSVTEKKLECAVYCRLITNSTLEMQTKIKEVLRMGLDTQTPILGTFQTCQHPTTGLFSAKECWKRIITEKGVCYSSRGNGYYNYLVNCQLYLLSFP